MNRSPKHSRVGGLDGLRGLAIILVLLTHAGGVEGAGMVGVLVFFVLSGFLITSLLLTEQRVAGSVDLSSFYLRRGARLLPALLGFLVLFVGFSVFAEGWGTLRELAPGLLQALLYLTDLTLGLQGNYRPELAHLWSHAVEEQFYLVWPICLILLTRLPAPVRLRRLMAAIALFTVMRVGTWLLAPHFDLFVYALPTTWVDVLLVGALCALVRQDAPLLWSRIVQANRWWVTAMALSLLVTYGAVPGSYRWSGTYVIGLPLLAVAACILVMAVLAPRPSRIGSAFSWVPLRAVGMVSYGLYLYNSTSIMLTQRWLGDGLAQRVMGLAIAVLLALLSWHGLGKPILRAVRARLTTPTVKSAAVTEDAPDGLEGGQRVPHSETGNPRASSPSIGIR